MKTVVAARFPDREIVAGVCADLIVSGFDPDDIEILGRGADQSSQPPFVGGHLTATEGILLGILTGVLTAGAWLLAVWGGHQTNLARIWADLAVTVTGGLVGTVAGGISGALCDVVAIEGAPWKRGPDDPHREWLLAVRTDDQHHRAAELVLVAHGGRIYDRRESGRQSPVFRIRFGGACRAIWKLLSWPS
jgi:hypothetical protein